MKKFLISIFILFSIGNKSFGQIINWPRTLTNKSTVLTMYQPQVENWQDYKNLAYRLAFSLTPNQGNEVLGVLYMTAKTVVNKEENTVLISNIIITKVHFPYEDATTAKNMEPKVRAFLDPNHTLTMSLNQVVACTPKEKS